MAEVHDFVEDEALHAVWGVVHVALGSVVDGFASPEGEAHGLGDWEAVLGEVVGDVAAGGVGVGSGGDDVECGVALDEGGEEDRKSVV